jgi:group I intron endonuclease
LNYFLYQTTNLVNNKFYIGVHKTKNLNDGYLGSGKLLRKAIKKYGKENFKREILEFFDSEIEMFKAEFLIVNEEFIKQKDTYNLKIGGEGRWDYIRNHSNYKLWQKKGNDSPLNTRFSGKTHTKETKIKISKILKQKYKDNLIINSLGFLGKQHTEETKRKIGNANSIYQKGSGNSQFGTMWITNGKQNKKIKKTDKIPENWIKGRKIKC